MRGDRNFAAGHAAAARQAARHGDVPGQLAAASVAEATLAWAQGDWPAVLDAVAPLRAGNLAVLTRNFDPFTWRLQQAEALLATGGLDQAARVLDEVDTAPARPPTTALAGHRLRAGLALARAQPAAARAALTRPASPPRRPPAPPPGTSFAPPHRTARRRPRRRRPVLRPGDPGARTQAASRPPRRAAQRR